MPALRFRRPLLVGFVALLALLATPVAAERPTRTVSPPPADFTTDLCGFPVLLHLEGDFVDLTFSDTEGNPVRLISTHPGGSLTLTNLETGETIVVHGDAGPGFVEFHPDGSSTLVGTGGWGFPFDPRTGEPGLFRVTGRFVVASDAAGEVTSFEFVGAVQDLCAALAG